MKAKDFSKIFYGICVLALVVVGYLSFIRKLNGGDSATTRNAKFLGIKSLSISTALDNQKDLSIDSTKPEESKTDNQAASQEASTTSKPATLYTVKEGDTYGCIAEAYYGSYEHWPDILNANSAYGNGFSEYGLHVGAVLELPAIDNLKPASKLCS